MTSGIVNNPWQQIGAPQDALEQGAAVELTVTEIANLQSLLNDTVAFEDLPAASEAPGRIVVLSNFATRPMLRSDGTYWRPLGGSQLIHSLTTLWTSATPPNSALQVAESFTLPAGMLFPGAALFMNIGADKLAGTSDTASIRVRLGGTAIFAPILATTNISLGTQQMARRMSATTVGKVGAGAASTSTALNGASTSARASAITVADLDSNDLVVDISAQMTTGTTEYATIHLWDVFLRG